MNDTRAFAAASRDRAGLPVTPTREELLRVAVAMLAARGGREPAEQRHSPDAA